MNEENPDGSKDHGLFHISDRWWCSPPGQGEGCDIECSALEDSDITESVNCAKKIFITEQSKTNNGFAAWRSYTRNKCNEKKNDYTDHCFKGLDENGNKL